MKSGAALRHMTESRWRGRFWNIFTIPLVRKRFLQRIIMSLSVAENCRMRAIFPLVQETKTESYFCIRFYQVQSIAVTESKWQTSAGLPQSVISKARNILNNLEEGILDQAIATEAKKDLKIENQIGMFEPRTHRALEELGKLEIEKLTPLEALQKLDELKKMGE